jgi:AcrR family transcriptional regulator
VSGPVGVASERVVVILESACRVIERDGAHGLRMSTVAVEAGVSKALIHYYFRTRRELLRAAFGFANDRLRRGQDDLLAQAGTSADKLQQVLLSFLDPDSPITEHSALFNEVWSSLRYDEELRPHVEQHYVAWIELLQRLLAAGREDGSIPAAVDPVAASWRLAAMVDGMESLRYAGVIDVVTAGAVMSAGIARELAGRSA